MSSPANRSLLFGMLALNNDLIDKHQLISAFHHWRSDKQRSLGQILVDLKALNEDDLEIIEKLVDRHLQKYDGDEVESLVGTLDFGVAVQIERQVEDSDIKASIAQVQSLCTQPPEANTSTVGRFKKWKWLGNGGLGVVSMARDEELNRNVALKEIRRDRADDNASRDRFNLEAEVTGGLEHPNIVPVYGFGRSPDGRPYYAMRFIPGDDLKSRIVKLHETLGQSMVTSLEFRKLILSLVSVCNALEYAHSRGIVHRDLKPQNIMLGDFGETLVIDWGLAKAQVIVRSEKEESVQPLSPSNFDKVVETDGLASGTPEYMSPEQAEGQHHLVDGKSDVFSVGATLYELLTNRAPYQLPEKFTPHSAEPEERRNERMSVRLKMAKEARIVPPTDLNPLLPKPLEAICLKAMAKSRQERYQSTRELADDLERWLADEPVLAWKEPLLVRTRRWVQRHRTLVSSLAAAFIAALFILSISVVLLARANQRAEQNFAFSRATVEEFFETVSEEQLLKQPGMERLRRDLLEKALSYYQEFLPLEDAPTTAISADMAENLYRVGLIQEQLEQPEKAIAAYQKAAAYQEQFVKEPEGRAEPLEKLSTTENALGRTLLSVSRFDEAKEVFSRALSRREEIVQMEPDNLEFIRLQANAIMNLGVVAAQQSRLDDSLKLQNKAQEIRKDALQKGDLPTLRRDLAKGHYNLAKRRLDFAVHTAVKSLPKDSDPELVKQTITQQVASEKESIDKELEPAIHLFQQLLEDEADIANLHQLLADCYRLRAVKHRTLQESANAAAWFEEAAQESEKMAISRPAIADYWVDSQVAARESARDYFDLGEFEKGSQRITEIHGNLAFLARQFPNHARCQNEYQTIRKLWNSLQQQKQPVLNPE